MSRQMRVSRAADFGRGDVAPPDDPRGSRGVAATRRPPAKAPMTSSAYRYMDHWFDNFFNAVISEVATPLLIPLPFPVLVASRLFRVCESLEKHSGVSGGVNVVHSLQQALPFAQMPHHHDWHHEGHKGSNYTFASLGGLWDVLFGTRHPGRAGGHAAAAATRDDTARVGLNKKHHCRNWLDHPRSAGADVSVSAERFLRRMRVLRCRGENGPVRTL